MNEYTDRVLTLVQKLGGLAYLEALASEKDSATPKMTCTAVGPFPAEQVRDAAIAICGCKGQYDCNCVTVKNIAIQNLYTSYNQANIN